MGCDNQSSCHSLQKKYYIAIVGTQTRTYVATPQHGPVALHTRLHGHQLIKMDFYVPWYGLWIIYKGPQIFMVMTIGLCVKQSYGRTLISLVLSRLRYTKGMLINMSLWWVYGTFITYKRVEFSCCQFWKWKHVDHLVNFIKLDVAWVKAW